ncbi:unnamed protein product [Lactuca saligna]|uniref:Uncharacterized protein n=1 Tax=Lactuca saligna TaxID=75948 RepID=A0AA35VI15_LACSI|nr:unnamed protein product [Lactuca saligna]
MSYVGNQSDMEDIWDWVLHPYLEEDQVMPRMSESETNCDPKIPQSPTPEDESTESDSSPKIVVPLPASSLSIYASGCRNITTPIKSIPIPSHKMAASLLSSSNQSKKPCPTHKWILNVAEWIMDDSIVFYEIGESSQAPNPIPKDLTYRAMSVLVSRVA